MSIPRLVEVTCPDRPAQTSQDRLPQYPQVAHSNPHHSHNKLLCLSVKGFRCFHNKDTSPCHRS